MRKKAHDIEQSELDATKRESSAPMGAEIVLSKNIKPTTANRASKKTAVTKKSANNKDEIEVLNNPDEKVKDGTKKKKLPNMVEEKTEPSAKSRKKLLKSNFSNTVFTDKNRKEMARFKRYHARVTKERIKAARYNTSIAGGLSNERVAERVAYGHTNYTQRGSTKTIGNIFYTNIFTFFNLLCFVVAGFLIWVGVTRDKEAFNDVFFLVIIFLNMIIGVYQEVKAKLIIEKLSLVSSARVKVIRNGEASVVSIDDIVLDDIVVLSNGSQIPADSIVLDGVIEVNESLLTGESNPIQKNKNDKIFAGSYVVSGTCSARVDKVGKDNYVQTLAKGASRYARPKSELLQSLRLIIRTIGLILVPLTFILIARQFTGGRNGFEEDPSLVRSTAGAIIGMIPSGMFLLTSLALAVGVINLAKSNTLVQELYCIEMLARVDTLCLDKTGTITDGTMKVCDVVEVKNTSQYTIREIIASMLWALEDNNQTAVALGNHFDRSCIIKAVKTMPFSSSRKLSAVSFEGEGTYVIGAPEFVLSEQNDKVDEKVRRFASQGYRVLLLARANGVIKDGKIPDGVKPVAIITIQDHVRAEAPKTIEWFKQNGVDVRVISGDNPVTVSEVARRAGINNADKYISLEGMSSVEVRAVANDYTVFGRVSPEQKLILIKELKHNGRTVAMTGDGVNDILALREADCSIAMATGSEAARNVSHLVLLDSNFSSMPKVVMEGRRVINNVQKSSSLFLFKTLFCMMLAVFVIMFNEPYIFTPANLYMLEFFVIGIPSFFLALEINNQKVKGKFIFIILKNAFVGALIVLINVGALYAMYQLKLFPSIATPDEFKTMCIYATTITGVMMLFKLIQPINVYRGILFMIMISCITAVATVKILSEIVGLTPIFGQNILLLIIIAQASYPLIAFLNNALAKIHIDNKAEVH